jgi:hypothetical protein
MRRIVPRFAQVQSAQETDSSAPVPWGDLDLFSEFTFHPTSKSDRGVASPSSRLVLTTPAELREIRNTRIGAASLKRSSHGNDLTSLVRITSLLVVSAGE